MERSYEAFTIILVETLVCSAIEFILTVECNVEAINAVSLRCSLKVSWKKAVVLKKFFSEGIYISSFAKDKITMFHLKRKISDCMRTIIMNPFCYEYATRASMLFCEYFNVYFNKTIFVNNFFTIIFLKFKSLLIQ